MKKTNDDNTENILENKRNTNKKILIIGLIVIFGTVVLSNIGNRDNSTKVPNNVVITHISGKTNGVNVTQVKENVPDEFK